VVTAIAYIGADGERYSPLDHWISELGQVTQAAGPLGRIAAQEPRRLGHGCGLVRGHQVPSVVA
jgi:hypothetical protein